MASTDTGVVLINALMIPRSAIMRAITAYRSRHRKAVFEVHDFDAEGNPDIRADEKNAGGTRSLARQP
jgi:hypothetical protein